MPKHRHNWERFSLWWGCPAYDQRVFDAYWHVYYVGYRCPCGEIGYAA